MLPHGAIWSLFGFGIALALCAVVLILAACNYKTGICKVACGSDCMVVYLVSDRWMMKRYGIDVSIPIFHYSHTLSIISCNRLSCSFSLLLSCCWASPRFCLAFSSYVCLTFHRVSTTPSFPTFFKFVKWRLMIFFMSVVHIRAITLWQIASASGQILARASRKNAIKAVCEHLLLPVRIC